MPTRRSVLINISRLAAAVMLASGAEGAERAANAAGDSDLELLAGVAYDILPYVELPAKLYVKVAQQVLDLQSHEVDAGLARVRDASHNAAWKDVPPYERVSILSAMQDTGFFRVLRASTLQVLLREPATFTVVGYGGPSIQYGGYLTRGFDDITWLPAATPK